MTKEEFEKQHSDVELETAMVLLEDLASYYEENEPYATNTINTFREAAIHLPSTIDDL
jgi:hypothetical protein